MFTKKIPLIIAFLFIPFLGIAQAVPPPVPPPPPPGLPIDGGVLFLFVAGLAYGVKAIRKN